MDWLTPLTGAILGAAVIPPLVLLYFLKLRRRTHPIACTLLWKRSVEDLQANAPFQKLRRNLLLLLQLLVLILLALSVAQPRLHAGRQEGGRTVMLIDNSASMTAEDTEAGHSRLEEAKVQAAERIETLYAGGVFSRSPGETMIVSFNEQAEIVCRFTESKQQLLAAIDRIRPTHAETTVDQALELARAFTTNVNPDDPSALVGKPATLELYSDGRIHDLGEQVLRGEHLNYYPIGSPDTENAAITSIAIERPYDRPTAVQVFSSVTNFGLAPVICDVQLSVDGVAVSIQEVGLPGATEEEDVGLVPGRKNVIFTPFEQPRGAVIEVAIVTVRNGNGEAIDDGLLADNVAQLVVPPPKRLRVLLVAPKHRLIRTTLEGMSLESLLHIRDPARFGQMAGDGSLERFDVVVLDGVEPESLPVGRYLVFGPPPPLEGLNPFGEGENQGALEWSDDHPVMRYVALDNLLIARYHLIEPADDVQVLAEGMRSPIITLISRGSMQVIYCPFDPLDTSWPFHRSWVNFLLNAVEYLGHVGSGLSSRGFKPGEALSARLPAGATAIELRTPDGEVEKSEPFDPALWSWGPARLSGLHVVSWDEPGQSERQEKPLAVNLLSTHEGQVGTIEVLQVGQDPIEGISAEDASYTPLWPWALGLCLAILMFEWWVYHRKTFL